MAEYEPTGWWRSIAPDGLLWGESSSESEIRQMARPGDKIQRHMRRVEERWEDAPPHPRHPSKNDQPRCPGCGNVLGGDNLCMVSACERET